MNHCTLQQLLLEVKQTLAGGILHRRWITAEISEMNTNYSGHCYLELIERKANSNDVCAKIRATIWASNYRLLKAYFETSTKMELQRGLKVLVCGSVEFHEVWGISINITDIDPVYTIGEQARRRQEIIAQLQSDGVIDMNKQLALPLVIQRIAVISSATAAGYGDFVDQLQTNAYNYTFTHQLFTAAMQGRDTESSVIAALEKIYEQYQMFDVVVIIRGGGSQSDLSSFDSYDIAANIAQFPLPVFTGIGHDRDDTVADLVAHTRLKTPTAVAAFIIDTAAAYDAQIVQYFEQIAEQVKEKIDQAQIFVNEMQMAISSGAQQHIQQHERAVLQLSQKIGSKAQRKISSQQKIVMRAVYAMHTVKKKTQLGLQQLNYLDRQVKTASQGAIQKRSKHLQHLEAKLQLIDPQRLLERGYSISLNASGRVIRSKHDVVPGQRIQTRLSDGNVFSLVE